MYTRKIVCFRYITVNALRKGDNRNDDDDDNNNNNNWKARHQGTTENSHIGHCTHTSGCTNAEVKKTYLTCEITLHVP